MGWLDKLKSLINFKVEINSPLFIITKNSNNTYTKEEYLVENDGRKVKILYDNLAENKQKQLKQILAEKFETDRELLGQKSSDLLQDLAEFQENKGDDKKVLDFFQNIIPDEDLEALESSLFLRRKFFKKEDVKKFKDDIRQRFGDRGNNIANLCTAGYFEKFLIPLFNSSKENFKEIYEVVVSKSVVAVFVHTKMNGIEIEEEIKTKIEISKKYGIKFLHIHGIGESNIRTIKNFVELNKELFNYYNKKIYEQEGIIIVELIF